MGIFIHMSISKAVTKREWENVYEETLQLVKAFPLAERRKVKCKGIELICLAPTVEREKTYGWHDAQTRRGWFADGDYETMHTAERYCLYREMVRENEVDINAGDALMGALPAYLNYNWDDPRCNHTYNIWGDKTQGEPYHLYLLSIACLIETRLGEKAFVYGDITRGQCIKAVELANEHLDTPIRIPDRCEMERFHARVSKLPMSEKEQFTIFAGLYLGTKDRKYGDYIRSKYSEEICNEYWKDNVEAEVELESLCEEETSEVFIQIMDRKRQSIKDERKKYDITTYEELIYYETGDRVEPNLLSALKQSFMFYNSIVEEESYKELMEQPARIRCEWLSRKNRSIWIREEDWNKIFTDIEENEQSFSRYYPVMRLKLEDIDLIYMAIAIVLNDDLYACCEEML